MTYIHKALYRWYKKKSSRFSGQDANAFGYASIYDIEAYIQSRYKAPAHKLAEVYLPTSPLSISQVTHIDQACFIVASARIASFLAGEAEAIKAYFPRALSAARSYLFTPYIGTVPFFMTAILNKLVKKVPKLQGYKARALYLWKFKDIQAILDQGLPLVMNILRGYYANHSISVVGYQQWSLQHDTITILLVYDGWHETLRYLDFSAFEKDHIAGGIASFNWLEKL
ncbi:MAG: hypothetical protein Q4E22_06295 [Coriobacteriia bacterium]|nr:hypothetical protein [Coriobacteriia bacterium]